MSASDDRSTAESSPTSAAGLAFRAVAHPWWRRLAAFVAFPFVYVIARIRYDFAWDSLYYGMRSVPDRNGRRTRALEDVAAWAISDQEVVRALHALGVDAEALASSLLASAAAAPPDTESTSRRRPKFDERAEAVLLAVMERRASVRFLAGVRAIDVLLGLMDFSQDESLREAFEVASLRRRDLAWFMAHGVRPLSPSLPDASDGEAPAACVIVHNDDLTPAAFVAGVFFEELRLGPEAANALMFQVHKRGSAIVFSGTREDALAVALRIADRAEELGHPLRVMLRDAG